MKFSVNGGNIELTISPSMLMELAKNFKTLSEEYLKNNKKDFSILSKPMTEDGKWSLNLNWKPEFDQEGKVINF